MLEKQYSPATNLVGFADIKSESITGWQEFLKEGNQFLSTAKNAYANKRKAFTAEILYNLVAMAIEKHIMALLMKSGNLPYNHTMHDLVESMEEFLPDTLKGLGDKIKALDAFQEICDKESYSIITPSMSEVSRMIDLAKEVQTITLAHVAN